MEENQDALLYYQLLEFRHEIMLSYMKSKEIEDLHVKDTNKNRCPAHIGTSVFSLLRTCDHLY